MYFCMLMINMLSSSNSKVWDIFLVFFILLWTFHSAKASGNMLQRELIKLEKYLLYFVGDWTITGNIEFLAKGNFFATNYFSQNYLYLLNASITAHAQHHMWIRYASNSSLIMALFNWFLKERVKVGTHKTDQVVF